MSPEPVFFEVAANHGPRSAWRCSARLPLKRGGHRCKFRSAHEGRHRAFGAEFVKRATKRGEPAPTPEPAK